MCIHQIYRLPKQRQVPALWMLKNSFVTKPLTFAGITTVRLHLGRGMGYASRALARYNGLRPKNS